MTAFHWDLVIVALVSAIGSIVVAVIANRNRKMSMEVRKQAELLVNQLTPTNGHRIAESVELTHDMVKELRRFVEEEFRFHRAMEH
jgi:phosphopantetheine adenylyltransferase